jgi:hypothetical protein
MTLKTFGFARAARWALAVIFVAAIAFGSINAQGVRKKVRFAKGGTSTVIKGAVIRAESDRYLVSARKGQTMTVKITSLEGNAVFRIYFSGEMESLTGGAADEGSTSWTGSLPADNDEYVIVVTPTRGNASYTLRISVK